MKLLSALTTLTCVSGIATASDVFARACAADNCARAVTGTKATPASTTRSADCRAFVQNTAKATVPAYASACRGAVPYSSACSCFSITSTSTSGATAPTTTTSCSPTYSSDPAFANLCPAPSGALSSSDMAACVSDGVHTPAQCAINACTDNAACKFVLIQVDDEAPNGFMAYLYSDKPAAPEGECAQKEMPQQARGSEKTSGC